MRKVLVLALLVLLPLIQVSAQNVLQEGDKAPMVDVVAEDGTRVITSRGISVLVFASPYCPHCRNELPKLSKAWKASSIGDKVSVFVFMYTGRDNEDTRRVEEDFWNQIDPPKGWHLVREPSIDVLKEYKVYAVPLIYVISNGEIKGVYLGEGHHDQVVAKVSELLGITVTKPKASPSETATPSPQPTPSPQQDTLKVLVVLTAVLIAVVAFIAWKVRSTLKKLSK